MLRLRLATQSHPAVDRAAGVVIRMWTEESGDGDPLRARISLVADVESGEATTAVAAGTHELLAAVRLFADEFRGTR